MSIGQRQLQPQPLLSSPHSLLQPSSREPLAVNPATAAPQTRAAQQQSGAAAGAVPSLESVFCPRGHRCQILAAGEDPYGGHGVACDRCSSSQLVDGEVFYHCMECRYDLCRCCATGNRLPAPVPVPLAIDGRSHPERQGRKLSPPCQQVSSSPTPTLSPGRSIEHAPPSLGPHLGPHPDAEPDLEGSDGSCSNLLVGPQLVSAATTLFEGRDAAGDWRREEMERALAQLEKNSVDLQRMVAAGFLAAKDKSEDSSKKLPCVTGPIVNDERSPLALSRLHQRRKVDVPSAQSMPMRSGDSLTTSAKSATPNNNTTVKKQSTTRERAAAAQSKPVTSFPHLSPHLGTFTDGQPDASLRMAALKERLRLAEEERLEALVKASQAEMFAKSVGLKSTFDLRSQSHTAPTKAPAAAAAAAPNFLGSKGDSTREPTLQEQCGFGASSALPSEAHPQRSVAPGKESFYQLGGHTRPSSSQAAAGGGGAAAAHPPTTPVAAGASNTVLAETERRLLLLSSTAASSVPSPSPSPSSVSASLGFFDSMKSESAKDVERRLQLSLGRVDTPRAPFGLEREVR
mmetsp:Transcript_18060/g.38953  ORF Transcript_18060/g.38953 Transcript_18060/m.38953 type:complete len:572 (+) Transcript_18060:81-1796(+)